MTATTRPGPAHIRNETTSDRTGALRQLKVGELRITENHRDSVRCLCGLFQDDLMYDAPERRFGR